MESKQMLMSALGVGIGVGVGIGLASGSEAVSRWAGGDSTSAGVTPHLMEQEMLSLMFDGRDSNVSFDQFPYYQSLIYEQTRVLLTSAAFVHLKKGDFAKHTWNLSPASQTILLSGPAELYQQMLAKALAQYFEAKLLLLDVTDFSLKGKYGNPYAKYVSWLKISHPPTPGQIISTTVFSTSRMESFKRSISETTLGRISELFGSFSILQQEEDTGKLRRQSSGVDFGSNGHEGWTAAKLRKNFSASANLNDIASTGAPTTSGLKLMILKNDN